MRFTSEYEDGRWFLIFVKDKKKKGQVYVRRERVDGLKSAISSHWNIGLNLIDISEGR